MLQTKALSVGLGDGNLEQVVPRNERRQACQ